MPRTMQALVVREPGRMEIQEVPVPVPGPNEVLARVRAVSICGTDAHLIRGDYPGFWPPSFPFIPGHEWAGEIAALGPGVDLYGWKVGDRVAGTSHDACGVCQKCVEGRYNLCENYGKRGLHKQYGHNVQGADAEYVVQGIKTVFPLPDRLSFDRARSSTRPRSPSTSPTAATSPRATPSRSPAPGRSACSAAMPRRSAARPGSSSSSPIRARLAKAAAMGFETVDPAAGDPVAAVRELTGGFGADVVLECAGVPVTVQWALGMLRRGGRCAAVGIPTVGVEIAMQRLVLDELELVGSRASAGEMRRVMPLVEQGRMRVCDVMTHHFTLADYAAALATFSDPTSGAIKIIVAP